ncbi:MAG: NAD(P)/FAD-dependent oxidoreductase [Deltaproteobacteria bacterium]|nr:NAD(P)/FAD-dependent oxidoreductase [Deltaproteobacteria bacterium]
MTGQDGERFDFVIVGGGPAGLSAGITAARNGSSALVLEQGDKPGPRPRGEGVNPYRLFDELLGKGFLEAHAFVMTHGSVYHSPGALKEVVLPSGRPLYFFEWREFMDRLEEVAREEGVTVRTRARVTGVLEGEERQCLGVRYADADGEVHEVRGAAVLGCDGYQSVIGQHYGVAYDRMSCPIMKCRLSGANFDPEQTRALQFYLIGHGDLPYAPTFPPCVAYAFPLADQQMEVGLMARMIHGHRMKTVDRPSQEAFVEVWSHLKEEYPGFREYFVGATIDHEEPTDLPNASLLRDNVPAPGAVLLGDSAGFVDPFGSSGIYYSMEMARWWTQTIAEALQQSGDDPRSAWSDHNISRWGKGFRATKVRRHIRGSYLKVGLLEWYVFKHLRTAERMNRRWWVVSALMKLG